MAEKDDLSLNQVRVVLNLLSIPLSDFLPRDAYAPAANPDYTRLEGFRVDFERHDEKTSGRDLKMRISGKYVVEQDHANYKEDICLEMTIPGGTTLSQEGVNVLPSELYRHSKRTRTEKPGYEWSD